MVSAMELPAQAISDLSGGRSESLLNYQPQLPCWIGLHQLLSILDQSDLDYGSDVLLCPSIFRYYIRSKEGISYVVDYNNMGRRNSPIAR